MAARHKSPHPPCSSEEPRAGNGRTAGRRLLVRAGVFVSILAVGVVLIEFAIRPFVSPDIVGPSCVGYDPVYVKALKPGYSGTLSYNGYQYRVGVNSMGFRGPEVRGSQRGGALFLGDSYAFG